MPHDKEYWQKVGARSRNKGKNFERRVAKAMGWTRVPYSGNTPAYGKADVTDSLDSMYRHWYVECKSRPNDVMDYEWFKDLDTLIGPTNTYAIALAYTHHGSSLIYVFLPRHIFRDKRFIDHSKIDREDCVWHPTPCNPTTRAKGFVMACWPDDGNIFMMEPGVEDSGFFNRASRNDTEATQKWSAVVWRSMVCMEIETFKRICKQRRTPANAEPV